MDAVDIAFACACNGEDCFYCKQLTGEKTMTEELIVQKMHFATKSAALDDSAKWFEFILELAERLGDEEISSGDIIWILSHIYEDFNPVWGKIIQDIFDKAVELAEFVKTEDMGDVMNLLKAVGMLSEIIGQIEWLLASIRSEGGGSGN